VEEEEAADEGGAELLHTSKLTGFSTTRGTRTLAAEGAQADSALTHHQAGNTLLKQTTEAKGAVRTARGQRRLPVSPPCR